jgi:hypothetical protein
MKGADRILRNSWLSSVAVLLLAGSVGAGEPTLSASQATAFFGTWVISMTNPAGSTETVKVWDQDGVVAATVQAGRFPPLKVTGVLKDGDMLVLTATRFENGKPIRAVISLTPDGDTMKMAQMLEFSETIKRGSGKREPAITQDKPQPR